MGGFPLARGITAATWLIRVLGDIIVPTGLALSNLNDGLGPEMTGPSFGTELSLYSYFNKFLKFGTLFRKTFGS